MRRGPAVSVPPATPVPLITGAPVLTGAVVAGGELTTCPTATASITYWLTNDHESVAKPLSPHLVPQEFSTRTPVES